MQSPSPQIPLPQIIRASQAPSVRLSERSATHSSLSAELPRRNRRPFLAANLGHASAVRSCFTSSHCHLHAKRPPGNRAAFSLGRIVPTEAKPSELSGCILSLAKTGVKTKTMPLQVYDNKYITQSSDSKYIRFIFVFSVLYVP